MIGAGDRGGVSADRGCKLLAMLAWLIISVPRAPKGSSRFRSSGRNFWPVANALRPGGKHKIPQNVSGLRNGIVPAAAGRRGGVAPWRSRLRPPKRRDRSSGTIHLKQIIPLARTWRVDLPALAQAVQAKRRHGVYRCRSSQRRGRPGDVRRFRPSKRGKPRPRGQRLEAAVTDRFGGFGRAGLGGFERAAFLLWKLLARRAPVGAGPIHKDRRGPSLFRATRSRR